MRAKDAVTRPVKQIGGVKPLFRAGGAQTGGGRLPPRTRSDMVPRAMPQRSLPLGLSTAVILALGVRFLTVFERLPNVVGSHFNFSGEADSFQDKATFVSVSLALHVALLLMFAYMPALLRRTPKSFINLPRRDYWLAPERAEESFTRMTPFLDWLGVTTLTFTAAVTELAVRANLRSEGLENEAALVLIGGYVVVVGIWTVRLRRIFH